VLFYLTAGVAYGEFRSDDVVTGSLVGTASYSTVRPGWAAGGGIEWMINKNWTARAEYLRIDLGNYSQNFIITTGGVSTLTAIDFRITNDIVRFSLNYYLR